MSKKIFECVFNVRHNNKRYSPGKTIELTEDEARELGKAVKPAAVTSSDVKKPSKSDNKKAGGGSTLTDEQKLKVVIEAVAKVDQEKSELWTKDSGPKTDVLTDMVGFDVSADLRNQAWAEHQKANPADNGQSE